MSFSEYYQRECAYLLEVGHEFGKRHSDASRLVSRSKNPYAERILEGVAFLTAKINERIDNGFSEAVEPILEMVAPHFLAPVPSCSVLAFEPALSSSRAAKILVQGTQVASAPNREKERPACVFRTTRPTTLLPLKIRGANYELQRDNSARLTIDLETHEAGRIALQKAGRVELFVNGGPLLASTLLLALDQHCTRVSLCETQDSGQVQRKSLGRNPLRLSGFDSERQVLPWSQGSCLRSHRMIAEYAILPEAFHFFELSGFEALTIEKDRFSLEFEFESPPEITGNILETTFRLHCAPIVNLFEVASDPVRISALSSSRVIRAQGLGPHDMEVFDVHSVQAQPDGGGPSEEVEPYFRFGQRSRASEDKPNYALLRRASPVDGGLDTTMQFCNWTPENWRRGGATRIVSMELRCTNRHHPRALGIGEICHQPKRGRKVPCSFRNLVAPTVPVRIGTRSQLQWRLAAVMSLRRSNLQDAKQLAALLELYQELGMLSSRTGAQSSFAQAISSLSARPMVTPVQGEVWSGVQLELELDVGELELGPAYILARLLNEVFAADVALNSFVQLKVRCTKASSGVLTSWSFPRRFASRIL